MYKEGRGIQKNEAEAVNWFRKAAEQGMPMRRPNSERAMA